MRSIGRLHAIRTQSLNLSVLESDTLGSALLAYVVIDKVAITLGHEVECQLEVLGKLDFEWVKLHHILFILRVGCNLVYFFFYDEDLAQSDVEELLIEFLSSEQHQIFFVVGYLPFSWDARACRNRVANDLRHEILRGLKFRVFQRLWLDNVQVGRWQQVVLHS